MSNDLVVSQPKFSMPAVVSSGNLPAPIKSGILDLLTAFAGAAQEDTDKVRLLRVYGEAVAGLNGYVADYAIRWLKLHNPRNPFRPTPQDVYETAAKVKQVWRSRVIRHFTETSTWGVDPYGLTSKTPDFEWGAKPLTQGSIIPSSLVREVMTEWLSYGDARLPTLVKLGRERLAEIPAECFGAGQLDKVLAEIADRERKSEEAAKYNAYLETLSPDIRRHRQIALRHGLAGDNPSEDDLVKKAQELLTKEQAELARRAEDAADEQKRKVAYAQPEVQAALDALHKARDSKLEKNWSEALSAYIAALTKHGAKPPPHLAIQAKGIVQ